MSTSAGAGAPLRNELATAATPPDPRGGSLRSVWVTVAAILGLLAIGVLRWKSFVWRPWVGYDEKIYIDAFRAVGNGTSPYQDPRFLYPAAFASVGSFLWKFLGEDALTVFRLANLAGSALLVWLAAAWSGWRPVPRFAIAASILTISPLIRHGFWYGNVSPLFAGLTALGVVIAERSRAGGGLVLGSVNALKPLSLPAIAVLASRDAGRRRYGSASTLLVCAGGAAAAWLSLGFEHLPGMLGRSGGLPEAGFNISFARVAFALGVEVSPAVVFLLVAAVGCLVAWRMAPTARQALCLATSTSLLALPVVNPSTLVLSYPTQLVALELAWRPARRRTGIPRWAVPTLVTAAVVSIHGGLGVVAAGEYSASVQALVALIPLCDVIALTTYALYATGAGGSDPSSADRPSPTPNRS